MVVPVVVVPVVVVPVVVVDVVVLPVVPVVPVQPGPLSPVQAHATPPPPARVRTVAATATAFRCFPLTEGLLWLVAL